MDAFGRTCNSSSATKNVLLRNTHDENHSPIHLYLICVSRAPLSGPEDSATTVFEKTSWRIMHTASKYNICIGVWRIPRPWWSSAKLSAMSNADRIFHRQGNRSQEMDTGIRNTDKKREKIGCV